MTDFAEDCIHLKACRRMCKFHNINNRGCRKDYCTAYENMEDFVSKNNLYTEKEVEAVKYGACRDGQSGYSGGDLLISDYV